MVATLTRIFGAGRLDLAEEVVQDALIKALERWPFHGVPQNPTAWLIQAAKHRALDMLRRESSFDEKSAELLIRWPVVAEAPRGEELDDQLAMIFMCCHPDLPDESRLVLALKTVMGFSVEEIARAFLTKEATIAQRLVRAKRVIRDRSLVFEVPDGSELAQRLDAALDVLYLLFNEGYAAHGGDNLIRAELCEEAIRLGSLVVAHLRTGVPKSHALLALMLLHAACLPARLPARVDEAGDLFLLSEQDRSRWDLGLIAQGLAHLDRSAEGNEMSAYHVEAGIAACHATAPSFEATDWAYIAELYDQLYAIKPTPVVALNRAVARSRLLGPEAGLREIDTIQAHHAMRDYYLLPAVEAEWWRELGKHEPAITAYQRALACPCTEPERRFLLKRVQSMTHAGHGSW
ncbi:MAG: sigma-70 family RNA polymerase sigma factor [Nitrospirae bacterium]|nr:sigma-70 family RNA polymerase sigma factor [Nitrospirota bacterium]